MLTILYVTYKVYKNILGKKFLENLNSCKQKKSESLNKAPFQFFL